MSDSETSIAAVPPPENDSPLNAEQQEVKKVVNLRIWPPTQKTRDAVLTRLVETLATPSVLSKRYGTIPQEEAESAARRIEEEAFGAASGTGASAEDNGLEILQLYSKEISKRMLETVKGRAVTATGSSAGDSNGVSETPSPVAAAGSEDNAVESEVLSC